MFTTQHGARMDGKRDQAWCHMPTMPVSSTWEVEAEAEESGIQGSLHYKEELEK
jgi:hypothetical protein